MSVPTGLARFAITRETAAQWIVLMIASAAVLAGGYGAASGNLIVAGAAVGLVAGAVLATSALVQVWLLIALGLVISGVTQLYLPSLQNIRWAAVPLALLLAIHALLARVAARREGRPAVGLPAVLWWAFAVMALVLVTVIVNLPDPVQVVRGLKGLFQVWGLMFGLALLPWPDRMMRRTLPLTLLWVGLLQLPFVAHEFLVLVPHRAASALKYLVPEDVISGTFGAQEDGGGANSLLAMFQFIVIAGLVALWQHKRLSGWRVLALSTLLLIPLFLNQAKVSLVYMAVMFLVLFGPEMVIRPARFFAVGLSVAAVLAAMLTVYAMTVHVSTVHDPIDLIVESYQENVGNDFEANGTYTRFGALRYWVRQHFPDDIFGAFVGHGVYESRTDAGGAAVLWLKVDKTLGLLDTSISATLWDVGLVVQLVIFAFIGSAYRTAGRLARHYRDDPWLAALFDGGRAAAAMLFTSLWFKSYFNYMLGYQTVLAMLFGWLAYWEYRRVAEVKAARAEEVRP